MPPNYLPTLDKRLTLALSMAEPSAVCADIGADHGQLSAALLLSGKAGHMLVADISDKSLNKARHMLQRLGLADQATFAVADGLKALAMLPNSPPGVIFILGMGGETLSGILLEGHSQLKGAAMILGAQTDLPLVRQTLCRISYRIRQECVAEENGRSYILINATPAADNEPEYSQRELLLGPELLKTLPPPWKPMLERRAALLKKAAAAMEGALTDKGRERLASTRLELSMIMETLDRY